MSEKLHNTLLNNLVLQPIEDDDMSEYDHVTLSDADDLVPDTYRIDLEAGPDEEELVRFWSEVESDLHTLQDDNSR